MPQSQLLVSAWMKTLAGWLAWLLSSLLEARGVWFVKCNRRERKWGWGCQRCLLDMVSLAIVRSFTRAKACPLSHECVCFSLVSC
jgi:hypothetical protein